MSGAFTVVIPARMRSTRLPNKMLADVAGKPLVAWAAERAKASGAARVVIATDHADIERAVRALGIGARAIALPDHYHFQPRDVKLPGAELIVMTEKDAVKCAAFADARMWFLRVEAALPREFDDFVLARVESSRRRADGPQAA